MDSVSENTFLVGKLLTYIRNRSSHEAIEAAMKSEGDITRMVGYENMRDCLKKLRGLDENGRLVKGYRVAASTHDVLIKHKKVFVTAFSQGGSESMRYLYATTAAALLHVVSILCAECIVLTKDNYGVYTMTINQDAVKQLDNSIFVTRLEKFVKQAETTGFKTLVTESAPMVDDASMHESFVAAAGTVLAAVTGIVALVYIVRDLVEKFYELRGTFSRWLEVQARFLDMNAAAFAPTRNAPRAKQEEYAARLRSLADRIRVDDSDTERTAQRGIITSDKQISMANRERAQTAFSPGSFQLV